MLASLHAFFDATIYHPIYNALVFLVNIVPGADVGIAIILLTVLIKLILFPLSMVAVRTQIIMREIDPKIKALRKEFKDKPEELARKTLALFKEYKINPFASIFLIFLQLPVIIGLYFVFFNEGDGSGFDPSILYPFVAEPMNASFSFLGIVDLTGSSIVLALLVAASQYVVSRMMMPTTPPSEDDEEKSFQADLQKSMQVQMRYVFPVVIGVIAYVISAAIALYFLVSNLFAIGQEIYVKRAHKEAKAES